METQPDSANKPAKGKSNFAHEEVLLSRAISKRRAIRINFLDGDYLVDELRWHTKNCLGLKSGKVVNKSAVKYWEVADE